MRVNHHLPIKRVTFIWKCAFNRMFGTPPQGLPDAHCISGCTLRKYVTTTPCSSVLGFATGKQRLTKSLITSTLASGVQFAEMALSMHFLYGGHGQVVITIVTFNGGGKRDRCTVRHCQYEFHARYD